MPARTSSLPLNAVLRQVAQHGLKCVEFDVVKDAALAVWYGAETPELESLQGPHYDDAVLLVERLSYYNVVPQSRKNLLLGRARQALAVRSEVARADFEAAYKAFLPRLQPLQTRHYAGPGLDSRATDSGL